jgi:Cu2+-exporting ATPase
MQILQLTIYLSLLLAGLFFTAYVWDRKRQNLQSLEQDALQPLREVGLFIKSDNIWGRLQKVRQIVFDKTGTLTMSHPRLLNPESLDPLPPDAMKALFILVDHNPHPRARSLREAVLTAGYGALNNGKARKIEESVGNGVSLQSQDGNNWSLGRYDWKSQNGTFCKDAADTILRKNGALIALFKFADDVRDDAQEAIANLKKLKLKTVILSGDTKKRVEVIADALKLDSTQAEGNFSAEDKAQWI